MDTRIVEQVSRDAKISKAKASKALEELERWVAARLESSEAVEIGSYGSFTTVDKKLDAKASRSVLPDPEIVFIPNPDTVPKKAKSLSKSRKLTRRSHVTLR